MANVIANHTGIAAVNSTTHLRVYSTTVDGSVVESQYEGAWTGSLVPQNVIGQGKILTPLSATSVALSNIRVYFLNNNNYLQESAYDSGSGWYSGALSSKSFAVAPYSSVGATYISNTALRVYAQLPDNTIQEFLYDSSSSGWLKGSSLGQALPGTDIAVISNRASSTLSIRVYFQDASLNVIEKAYDNGKGWYTGSLTFPVSIPRASLGALSWTDSSWHIRLYYSALGNPNLIKEKAWDGSWADGQFSEASIPASRVAGLVVAPGDLRVYLQNGTEVTAVSEWMSDNGWEIGANVAGGY
ncbi:fucose-specific lectin [Xylariales sp. PMI_506]|nr:fucose-specific lectin [Xylariales sp. PMI_506]